MSSAEKTRRKTCCLLLTHTFKLIHKCVNSESETLWKWHTSVSTDISLQAFAHRLQHAPAVVLITHLLPALLLQTHQWHLCLIVMLLCAFHGISVEFVNDLEWVVAAVFYQIVNMCVHFFWLFLVWWFLLFINAAVHPLDFRSYSLFFFFSLFHQKAITQEQVKMN